MDIKEVIEILKKEVQIIRDSKECGIQEEDKKLIASYETVIGHLSDSYD